MRKLTAALFMAGTVSMLAACSSGGIASRERPDELAVARQAPLVVPPDFALVPPRPGAPRPQGANLTEQALEAMFGGPSARSTVESDTVSRAGKSEISIRSTVGDGATLTIAKGEVTADILAAPEGDGIAAQSTIPG